MSDSDQIGNWPGGTSARSEGKRGEAPAPDDAVHADDAAAGPPAGGVAVPPDRPGDRPGYGGIEEAALGAGSGDLGGGGDLSGDVGALDDEDHGTDG
jgi:hypothetical protein